MSGDFRSTPPRDNEFGALANDQRYIDKTLRQIDDLLRNPRTLRVQDTLEGIKATIERTNRVTAAQERAIQNIARVAVNQELDEDDQRRTNRPSRRYEGY